MDVKGIRTGVRALTAIGALVGVVALFGLAASAGANTVTYAGQAKNLKPGQTKGLPVGMDFNLSGKKCPKGPKCFKHAKILNFTGVSYAFPNCPELLDSAFYFGDPNAEGPLENTATPFGVEKNRTFDVTGGNSSDFSDVVTLEGKFAKKGKSASGTFTVVRDGICSTDAVSWEAEPTD